MNNEYIYLNQSPYAKCWLVYIQISDIINKKLYQVGRNIKKNIRPQNGFACGVATRVRGLCFVRCVGRCCVRLDLRL